MRTFGQPQTCPQTLYVPLLKSTRVTAHQMPAQPVVQQGLDSEPLKNVHGLKTLLCIANS
jgi:hypothetical protein